MNSRSRIPSLRSVAILLGSIATCHSETLSVDLCVYGGTSGAIASAVQAKRMGKSVVVVSPDRFLGGVTSGGLGFTDIGDERILGGLSLEFFNRVYDHYQKAEAWTMQPKSTFSNKAQGGSALNEKRKTMSVFEPKVAAAVFDGWVREHAIRVIRSKLDRGGNGLVKEGASIRSIRTLDGHTVAAKMFIDATYEGDLLALAGVAYTIGREASSKYGESGNGIQPGHHTNQLPRGIDPYVIAKNPASGLLPGVNPDAGGAKGAGDHRVQAYCYRMCLTNHEPNLIPITQPDAYQEKDYELVLRAIEAGQKSRFFKFSALPNHKTDSNNDSGASTDLIGMNYNYPEADYPTRDKLAAAHKHWQLGLIWTLQHHPRVPEGIRNQHLKWGLPKDEFTENENWAHALYIREARRMVSDYVVTQEVIANQRPVARPVGMGAYMMDSHHVQRHVTDQGDVQNEGDVQIRISGTGPYSIDYGAIIPKQAACDNLFATFCVSASHIAFGSIRMEPVFMVLSQSAATAAAIAIDRGLPVQEVPYEVLQKRLLEDGQRLSL